MIVDKKIILAIVIVALIGVVAATYQITDDNSNILNPLASVETEEDSAVTDLASVSGDSANANPAGSDSGSDNGGSVSSQASGNALGHGDDSIATGDGNSSSKKSVNTVATTKTSSKNKTNSTVKPTQKTNRTPDDQTTTISRSRARSIALSAVRSNGIYGATAQVISVSGSGSSLTYTVAVYKDGSTIGEYYINRYGTITGGAVKYEAPDPDDYESDIDEDDNNGYSSSNRTSYRNSTSSSY